ncbi:MAG TPA: hypothetical protein VMH80_26835 [Bryobacteraceae bacterium]|nr:hypothetical protein [Bryobacteraceae bacterium]
MGALSEQGREARMANRDFKNHPCFRQGTEDSGAINYASEWVA